MRKFVHALLLATLFAGLASGVIGAGIADANTGHVITIHDATVDEGSGNALGGAFVSMSVAPAPQLGEQVKVDFGTTAQATQGATAKSSAQGDPTPEFPEDFAQTDGTMTFEAGATDATFVIPMLADNSDEANEKFFVQLFNPRSSCVVPGTCESSVSVADDRSVVTITDDDAEPTLAVDSVSHEEGNGADTTAYEFTVTKTGGSGEAVKVDYATVDDSAKAAEDFDAKSGTLTFPASSPTTAETQKVTVPVKQDTTFESNEAFGVKLANALNAAIEGAEGAGTIENDDLPPPPALTVSDVTVDEGGVADFLVKLASPPGPGQSATVDWAVQQPNADAATEGVDYVAAAGSTVFTAGESERTVSVATLEDDIDEPAEKFDVKLTKPATSGTGGYTYELADDRAVATITDNDEDSPVSFEIDDVSVTEGDSGVGVATFTVSKTGVSGFTASVGYATANGSATVADFVAKSGTLTFGPADVTKTVAVDVKGDAMDEVNETFLVNLSDPTNATIADAEAVGTIADNDAAPSIKITDARVAESATKACTLTVTLSAPSGRDVWFGYATRNGTATTSDYVAKSGAAGFVDGDTAIQLKIFAKSDSKNEPKETFSVNLSGASPAGSASFGDSSGKCTILDND